LRSFESAGSVASYFFSVSAGNGGRLLKFRSAPDLLLFLTGGRVTSASTSLSAHVSPPSLPS